MRLKNYFKNLVSLAFLVIAYSGIAQDVPFNCDFNAYLFQNNDVFALNLASGSSFEVATDIVPGKINATGYNPSDGYIWGSLTEPARSIVRIGANFQTTTFTIPELPTSNRYVGDVSNQGIYYLKGGGTSFYKINIDPGSTNYGTFAGQGTLSHNINIHDWAFNAVDEMLYSVEKNSNRLFRISPETGLATDLGIVPILSGLTYTYGAVYFDASGRFYVSANQTGTIFVIQDVQNLTASSTINSNLFAYGPSSSSNDGARCPTAPVPQEICDNGIDDDGDGLIDCDDPSCSGIASCPAAPIDGGNNGGLESNNRLAIKISERNFNRAKTNYIFNKNQAKKVIKNENYGQKTRNGDINLSSLIPIGIIDETNVIESTPNDLLDITNASEILSVDYEKNNETIAALLLLKTETKVYEHTKYICDRLLGAELLSVATITINDQNFIRSIIKNVNGQIEYVISFSARQTSERTFEIENHWNLDTYFNNSTYYNFQIWSNSIDNLLLLGEEALRLVDIQKPITSYRTTPPPAVFVKKGIYKNGVIELEIANNNKSNNVFFEGGYKRTETEATVQISEEIILDNTYLTYYNLETGNLFDIGFRIQNNSGDTPDDVFLSDGPWGVDDFATSTNVQTFKVRPSNYNNTEEGFIVERNIELKATTSEYVSIYRAFTPRFKAVDLSNFNGIKFEASGSGSMEITILKNDITVWESQFKVQVALNDSKTMYQIPFTSFRSTTNENMILNDATTIVFTMISESGAVETKELNLYNLSFTIIKNTDQNISEEETFVYPNPITAASQLVVRATKKENVVVTIYNPSGIAVNSKELEVKEGVNYFSLKGNGLAKGLYLYQVVGKFTVYEPGKFIIN